METIKFNFLNVGHGDSTVILDGLNTVMIDINTSEDYSKRTYRELSSYLNYNFDNLNKSVRNIDLYSDILRSKGIDLTLENPISFLKKQFTGIDKINLKYFQTHPDKDHFRGIHGLYTDQNIRIIEFFDVSHAIEKKEINDENTKLDWDTYSNLRQSDICKSLSFYEKFMIGEMKFHIFHPDKEAIRIANEQTKPNQCSMLILIETKGKKILLGGDVETNRWESLYQIIYENDEYRELFSNIDIFKASHHGRESGKCDTEGKRDFLNLMDPSVVIISVGTKGDTDRTDWYRQRSNDINGNKRDNRRVLSTIFEGNIYCDIEENNINIITEKEKIEEERLVSNPLDSFPKNLLISENLEHKIKPNHKFNHNIAHASYLQYPTEREEFLEMLGIEYDLGRYIIIIDADVIQNGFRKNTLSTNPYIGKEVNLKFFIKSHNIPKPYTIYWKVRNSGEEAKLKHQLRGEIMEDFGFETRNETSSYKGEHYVECYIVKDKKCVATNIAIVSIR